MGAMNDREKKKNIAFDVPAKNKKHEKSSGKRPKKYRCNGCHYTSTRQYNVVRHEERIHTQKLDRSCCDKVFYTKGEWYFHCEVFHPHLRAASSISKKKYKIVRRQKKSVKSSIATEEQMERRRSTRIKESIKQERSMMLIKFNVEDISELEMDDVPLIYFIQHRKLRQKFIEKSCETHNNNHRTILSEEKSSDSSCPNLNSFSSLTISGGDSYAEEPTKQAFYNDKIVATKSQTVEYMSCSNNSNIYSNNSIKNIAPNSQSTIDITVSSSTDFARASKIIGTPTWLPLKKRILQELRNDSIGHNHHRRLKEKSLNENKIFKWNDKENINPVSRNHFGINVSQKATVTADEQSVTWNEITKHHRAYLSSVDWDRYKLY